MTDQEAFEAWVETREDIETEEDTLVAMDCWIAALEWLRSQGEPRMRSLDELRKGAQL